MVWAEQIQLNLSNKEKLTELEDQAQVQKLIGLLLQIRLQGHKGIKKQFLILNKVKNKLHHLHLRTQIVYGMMLEKHLSMIQKKDLVHSKFTLNLGKFKYKKLWTVISKNDQLNY